MWESPEVQNGGSDLEERGALGKGALERRIEREALEGVLQRVLQWQDNQFPTLVLCSCPSHISKLTTTFTTGMTMS